MEENISEDRRQLLTFLTQFALFLKAIMTYHV